ncbi:hypothetical protein BT69DRAFT_1283516 [Atractiella rhizophila]|nr:hypothetical protein BT69DRAFT_1283516 [Atractiella rhizophila]
MYIRGKKKTLWICRLEGDGYFRPNPHIFVPPLLSIFSIVYIVFLIGTLNHSIPHIFLYANIAYIPLQLSAHLWVWNSLLAASHARKSMPPQSNLHWRAEQRGLLIDCKASRLKISPRVAHIAFGTFVVFSLTTIIIYSVLSSSSRERALASAQELLHFIQSASASVSAGQPVDVDVLPFMASRLGEEVNTSRFYYKRLIAFQFASLVLDTLPYMYALAKLFSLLWFQRRHLEGALERLQQLEAMDRYESETASSKPRDSVLSSAASLESTVSTEFARSITPSPAVKFQAGLLTRQRMENQVLARQQSEVQGKLKEWHKCFRTMVVMHILTLIVMLGYDYCFVIPQLIGSTYLLFEATQLPSRASNSKSRAHHRMPSNSSSRAPTKADENVSIVNLSDLTRTQSRSSMRSLVENMKKMGGMGTGKQEEAEVEECIRVSVHEAEESQKPMVWREGRPSTWRSNG